MEKNELKHGTETMVVQVLHPLDDGASDEAMIHKNGFSIKLPFTNLRSSIEAFIVEVKLLLTEKKDYPSPVISSLQETLQFFGVYAISMEDWEK